jgi:hypothetical protein
MRLSSLEGFQELVDVLHSENVTDASRKSVSDEVTLPNPAVQRVLVHSQDLGQLPRLVELFGQGAGRGLGRLWRSFGRFRKLRRHSSRLPHHASRNIMVDLSQKREYNRMIGPVDEAGRR